MICQRCKTRPVPEPVLVFLLCDPCLLQWDLEFHSRPADAAGNRPFYDYELEFISPEFRRQRPFNSDAGGACGSPSEN